MTELSGHLTAAVSHELVKFLTKPFVLQASKKFIIARREQVLFYLFIFFQFFFPPYLGGARQGRPVRLGFWPQPLIAPLPGKRVILFDFSFHLPAGESGLNTALHMEAWLTGNLSNYGEAGGGGAPPVKY